MNPTEYDIVMRGRFRGFGAPPVVGEEFEDAAGGYRIKALEQQADGTWLVGCDLVVSFATDIHGRRQMEPLNIEELIGRDLDMAVARCEGLRARIIDGVCAIESIGGIGGPAAWVTYSPSSNPVDGWAIIERDKISTIGPSQGIEWRAHAKYKHKRAPERLVTQDGPTALIAAMRAHVASFPASLFWD